MHAWFWSKFYCTVGCQTNSGESCNPMSSTLPRMINFKRQYYLISHVEWNNVAELLIRQWKYPSKQEDAVRSHWSATSVASQAWTPSRINAENHGQSPWADGRSVRSVPGRSGCIWTGRLPHSESMQKWDKHVLLDWMKPDDYQVLNKKGRALDACDREPEGKWPSIGWVRSDGHSLRSARCRCEFRCAPWYGRTWNDRPTRQRSPRSSAVEPSTWAMTSWENRHISCRCCCLRWRRCSPHGSTDERN